MCIYQGEQSFLEIPQLAFPQDPPARFDMFVPQLQGMLGRWARWEAAFVSEEEREGKRPLVSKHLPPIANHLSA